MRLSLESSLGAFLSSKLLRRRMQTATTQSSFTQANATVPSPATRVTNAQTTQQRRAFRSQSLH